MISAFESYFVAAALFAIGAAGVVLRRNALVALYSVTLMTCGATVDLIVAARGFDLARGVALGLLALLTIVLQIAVGTRLLRGLHRSSGSLDMQAWNVDD